MEPHDRGWHRTGTGTEPTSMSNLTNEMFKYLAELASMNVKQVRNLSEWTVEGLDRPLTWLGDVPDHPNVRSPLPNHADPGDPAVVLSIRRPALPEPPTAPSVWQDWAADAGIEFDPEVDDVPAPVSEDGDDDDAADGDEVRDAADQYQTAIDDWRPGFQLASAVLSLYSSLWKARRIVETDPERFQTIAAVGLLDWVPDGQLSRRPVVVLPSRIDFDPEDQRIDVVADIAQMLIETDMLPVTSKPSDAAMQRLRDQLDELETIFDAETVAEGLTGFVSDLPASGGRGSFDPSATFGGGGGRDPQIVFAPLVAVRPRSARARVEALEALADAEELSTALQTMVSITDAHDAPLPRGEETADRFHPEVLLPEPSSQAQRQMALSMERNPLTVVLGPPGTGKTYTIANLLGHLLAQGKRVLVTAEKEEALHEVRGKVLEALQPLVVPVLAGKAEDKTRLAQAIGQISNARQDRPLSERADHVQQLRDRQKQLHRDRSELLNRIEAAWQDEHQDLVDDGPFRGDLERVADAVAEGRESYGWMKDRPSESVLPLTDDELEAVRRLAETDVAGAAARQAAVPDADRLPTAKRIKRLTKLGRQLQGDLVSLEAVADRPAAESGPHDSGDAELLRSALEEAAATIDRLRATPRPWVEEIVDAARRDTLATWEGRLERLTAAVEVLDTSVGVLGTREVVPSTDASPAALRRAAESVAVHLPDGKRLGWLKLKAEIREAARDLTGTTVDGSPVDTAEEARAVVAWADAQLVAAELITDWDGVETLPLDGPIRFWNDHLRPLADALGDCLQLTAKAPKSLAPLRGSGVDLRDPWDSEELRLDGVAIGRNAVKARLDDTIGELRADHQKVARTFRNHQFYAEIVAALKAAREELDAKPWCDLLDTIAHEAGLRQQADAGAAAVAKTEAVVPNFAAQLRHGDQEAFSRLGSVREAVAWAHAAGCLAHAASRAGLLDELRLVEQQLADARRDLVCESAWAQVHQRLDEQGHLGQALRDYAAAQQRVPKGKSAKRYLPNLRRAQRALERCSAAVPVWVMSVDRAAEMFGAGAPDLFDVVIVDEASQCPITSALVMQYAPSVAIVGDPFQTSPPSFKRYENLEAARRRISDIVVRDRLDPDDSLWKIADSIIDRITLTEHFRCPPEVIGWARNDIYKKIAGLRLDVLTGTNPHRPKPVISRFVADGVRDGDQNEAETEVLLEDLEGLLADLPSWVTDIGVIALKPAQAAALQRAIFDRFDQRTLERLDLRVGTAYEFQGAQRDLVLISMVDSPPELGKTHQLRSSDTDTLNQLNVAVSRAREQLRLYHSVLPGAYKTEDVRRWLLEHVLAEHRAWDARQAPGVPAEVSETQRVAPFDSLSEQRLFNRLVRRGFAVRAQVPAPVGGANYRLDFVVDGQVGAMVVEYDGPHHDTPAQYLDDREREQDLIRCGWNVVRVHHADFNHDRDAAVAELEQSLRTHGITPVVEWDVLAEDAQVVGDEATDDEPLESESVTPSSLSAFSDETDEESNDSSDVVGAASPDDAPSLPEEDDDDLKLVLRIEDDGTTEDKVETDASSAAQRRSDVEAQPASSNRVGVESKPSRDVASSAAGQLQLASRASALLAAGPLQISQLGTDLGIGDAALSDLVALLTSFGFHHDGDTIREP